MILCTGAFRTTRCWEKERGETKKQQNLQTVPLPAKTLWILPDTTKLLERRTRTGSLFEFTYHTIHILKVTQLSPDLHRSIKEIVVNKIRVARIVAEFHLIIGKMICEEVYMQFC